jgi:hypothetical protein
MFPSLRRLYGPEEAAGVEFVNLRDRYPSGTGTGAAWDGRAGAKRSHLQNSPFRITLQGPSIAMWWARE